jgi:hypothetical protein
MKKKLDFVTLSIALNPKLRVQASSNLLATRNA